jgi:putative membrane protein
LWLGDAGHAVTLFFLVCVLVAGLFGGFTATRKVLWVQGLPALIGIALVMLS